MINGSVIVEILYRYRNDNIWREAGINSEDYFDKNYLDKGEVVEVDSIPLFAHAIEYIEKTHMGEISNTRVSITNSDSHEKIEINETYWNDQRNSIVERIDTNSEGRIDNNEIILTSLVNDSGTEEIWEVIRFRKENSVFSPVLHTFTTEDENGLISDRKIIP
ncbi:MAG: hypothetical protein FWG40_12810 [Peptococcaceae bacterium]|nr:hypothetical protein [Peptococcaceae bacterium]